MRKQDVEFVNDFYLYTLVPYGWLLQSFTDACKRHTSNG